MSWEKRVHEMVGYAQMRSGVELFTFLFMLEITGFSVSYPQMGSDDKMRLAVDFCG